MRYRDPCNSPIAAPADIDEERTPAMNWLSQRALPFWTSTGYDSSCGLFHERVALDGTPFFHLPRRLMVQCRQMYVLAHASMLGMCDGQPLLERTFTRVLDWYRRGSKDGRWVFSVHLDGTIADPRCDSYTLAFVLMALAWLYRLRPDAQLLGYVDEIYAMLDGPLAARGGGVVDGLPRSDQLRRQNPNMHLLEAYLFLYEATWRKSDLDRALALYDLFASKLFDWPHSALPELHDHEWHTAEPEMAWFEPGHHFEWVWLLRRLARLAPVCVDSCAEALLARASTEGVDGEGFAIDRVQILSGQQTLSRRCWSTCEYLKASVAEMELGRSSGLEAKIVSALRALRMGFLASAKPGLWVDRIDEHGNSIFTDVPASTFYHLFLAFSEVTRVVGSVGSEFLAPIERRRAALFIDRDGVLNHDIGYPVRPADIHWIEDASRAVRIAENAGYAVVVVSNQSCVARGYATEREVRALHQWMAERLAEDGAFIDAWYYCPYHPAASNVAYRDPCHPERKPNPGLILRAALELNLDLKASLLIGDKGSDLDAAHRAGIAGYLFPGGNLADFVAGILKT